MVTRYTHKRWLHLRWCHYYQWKNLLTDEQEARHKLEQLHQRQTSQALLANTSSQIAHLINAQLVSLAQLRKQLQQKRFALQKIQHQQMEALQAELMQTGAGKSFHLFQTFSVLRQP